ncbi:MAG: argininosuccinate lyase [Rhodobacteraceae bacterium]|nr:argininosuccinate lyase [Paracoccaceae bacterium]MCP5342658.1 argininosuccinate lyase [Paracoccaceae bacterium]
MKAITLLLAALALAACGADGEPTPPQAAGLTVSGQVKVGIGGSL